MHGPTKGAERRGAANIKKREEEEEEEEQGRWRTDCRKSIYKRLPAKTLCKSLAINAAKNTALLTIARAARPSQPSSGSRRSAPR
mmetsp:Transcript_24186/g.64543  ORF Transcript_24186/g.64543 Transcript_24186/m.64543 type:complete len:85 (-) Transcript_24186:466-720(-)